LADERRRYLIQQMELGGSEVVLERSPAPPTTPGPGATSAPATARGPARAPQAGSAPETPVAAAAAAPAPAPAARAARPDAAEPKWKKGAPPVPGPGLTVEPPAPSLLSGDPLADLESLDVIAERIRACESCALCAHRTNAVPGEGNPHAGLVFVGEGPGATEDATGRPFVGQAGKLLDEIIAAIGFRREDVYIANVVKCRPPQNRTPLPDEIAACMPYLRRQLALIKPKVIVALGATAAAALLDTRKSLGELRGKVHLYGGIPLVVTYHPAALLRNPNWKKPTWDDVRIARQLLDR
jgi:DNA polymerase